MKILENNLKMTVFIRMWSMLVGFLTTLLIALCLNPELQGYYYVILSIGALQALVELGLGQVIIQLVAHECTKNKKIEFEFNHELLNKYSNEFLNVSKIFKYYKRWYEWLSIFYFIIAYSFGFYLISNDVNSEKYDWQLILFLYLALISYNIRFIPGLAMYEGLGKIAYVAKIRFLQSLIGNIFFVILLLLNCGLWSIISVPFFSTIFNELYFSNRNYLIRKIIGIKISDFTIYELIRDSRQFQIKMAISWLFGVLIFNIFTPAIFKYYGAVEAGRYAITVNIFNSIQAIALSWVVAIPNKFSELINSDKINQFYILVLKEGSKSVSFFSVISILFMISLNILNYLEFKISARLLDQDVFVLVFLTILCNTVISIFAIALRAFRDEPTLIITIIMGSLSVLSILFMKDFNLFEIQLYLLITHVLIGLPLVLYIAKKKLTHSK